MEIKPTGAILGADITGIDLATPLSPADFRAILRALGAHGVLRFPAQTFNTDQFAAFGARFGELEVNVANLFHEPGHPEVMILSNILKDGKPTGLGDAGQGWHTDMSYSETISICNILHAQKVPVRDGRPLGDTQFRNLHAAYEDLPADIKARLAGRTATHDFAKFWDMMRARPGNTRPPLTEAQRARKPAVSHPIFMTHPITGRKVLYLQRRLRHPHRRHGPRRERRNAGLSVPPPGAGEIPLRAPLDRGRRADVGQHRHHAQRHRRLRRPPPLHAPGPGHGHRRLRRPGGVGRLGGQGSGVGLRLSAP